MIQWIVKGLDIVQGCLGRVKHGESCLGRWMCRRSIHYNYRIHCNCDCNEDDATTVGIINCSAVGEEL